MEFVALSITVIISITTVNSLCSVIDILLLSRHVNQ